MSNEQYRCLNKEMAMTEAEKYGKNSFINLSYRETGCYTCDGQNRACKSYFPKKELEIEQWQK